MSLQGSANLVFFAISTKVVSHFQFLNCQSNILMNNSFTGFLLILALKRCERNKNIFATGISFFIRFHQLIMYCKSISFAHSRQFALNACAHPSNIGLQLLVYKMVFFVIFNVVHYIVFEVQVTSVTQLIGYT